MKLTYDGDFGHVSHDVGVVSEGNPLGLHYAPAMGTFDGHGSAQAEFQAIARWKAQTWADYMPGQPNPFVPR